MIGVACTIAVALGTTLFSSTSMFLQGYWSQVSWKILDESLLEGLETETRSVTGFGYTRISLTARPEYSVEQGIDPMADRLANLLNGVESVVAEMQLAGWPFRCFWGQQIYSGYSELDSDGMISINSISLDGLSVFGWAPKNEHLPYGFRIIPFLVNSLFYTSISLFIMWRMRKRREFVRLLRIVEQEINQKTQC